MSNANTGIWGIGAYLPPIVRGNDWWPASVVAEWKLRQGKRVTRATVDVADGELPPGAKLALEAAAEVADDPFEGARQRFVMPDDMAPSDMQIAAARLAIADAGIDPKDLDFLLIQTTTPDYIHVPDGCRVHAELGLSPRCYTMMAEGMCNAFIQHLVLADGLLRSGAGKLGLIIQCCVMSRHMRPEDPFSAWFGDGATAAVVGPVGEGRGVLGHAHATYGEFHGGLVSGVPGKRWYDDGKVEAYVEDQQRARGMMLAIPDSVKELAEEAIARAGVAKADVRYFGAHQASIWLGRVVQRYLGLEHAHRVDSFPWAASLTGCNLPLGIVTARKEGQLRDGDLMVMFSGAAGMTVGAMVARWGR